MKQEKKRKIISVIGKSGWGKSHFVKQYIHLFDRLLVLDVMNEDEYSAITDNVFYDFDEFKDFIIEHKEDEKLKIVVRFDDDDDYINALALAYEAENFTVIIEEMHNFSSGQSMSKPLSKILRLGRHKSISIIGISHRLFDCHNVYRMNIDCLVAFNVTTPSDIDYFKKIDWIGEEGANQIEKLERFKCKIFYNN